MVITDKNRHKGVQPVIKVSKTKCLMGEEETYEERFRRLQRRYRIIMILGIIVAIVCQILKILLSTPSWAYGTLDTLTLLGTLSSILSAFTSATRWEIRQELRQLREDLLRALGEIRDLLKRRK
jgi:hypothetical protein